MERSIPEPVALPAWLVKAAITTAVGALITGGAAWGVNLSKARADHEKRITVVETKTDRSREDMKEIKSDLKEMNQKLDRLIERRR